MSTTLINQDVEYPTGDGKPMAETPIHRQNLVTTIELLEEWYADRHDVYVSGNMFVYYREGDKRRHVSPDVFAVLGVPERYRDIYCTWLEPKPTLDLVVEFTSKSRKREDEVKKFQLYLNVLGVREYLLFDPFQEYLKPAQKLYRLVNGEYVLVPPVAGRLPSETTGLHFERDGIFLRLYDPQSGLCIPTRAEREHARAEQALGQAEHSRQREVQAEKAAAAESKRAVAERLAREQAEAELAQLKAELAALRQQRR